jgi:hypothetical protein
MERGYSQPRVRAYGEIIARDTEKGDKGSILAQEDSFLACCVDGNEKKSDANAGLPLNFSTTSILQEGA